MGIARTMKFMHISAEPSSGCSYHLLCLSHRAEIGFTKFGKNDWTNYSSPFHYAGHLWETPPFSHSPGFITEHYRTSSANCFLTSRRARGPPAPSSITLSPHNPDPQRYNILINTTHSQNHNRNSFNPTDSRNHNTSPYPRNRWSNALTMILQLAMICSKFRPGCRLSSPTFGITVFKRAAPKIWVADFCVQRDSEAS